MNRTSVPIVVTHESGVRFAIRIRSHELIVDQTLAGGGRDSGPTPVELLGASLGSCIAYYVHHFFHTRGLPADAIRVEVTQTGASNPNRVASFRAKVYLPAEVSSRYLPLLQRVVDACPAHNTLSSGTDIHVEFETPVQEMAEV
jgi:uncharacterized OsmC-like protein